VSYYIMHCDRYRNLRTCKAPPGSQSQHLEANCATWKPIAALTRVRVCRVRGVDRMVVHRMPWSGFRRVWEGRVAVMVSYVIFLSIGLHQMRIILNITTVYIVWYYRLLTNWNSPTSYWVG